MMDLASMRAREDRVLADAGIVLPALPQPGKVVSRDAPAIPTEEVDHAPDTDAR